jgi:N-acetylmuramoyl-L-alanine amidase CwlA
VNPDDGKLGVNQYNNHWNTSACQKCVHAFIGKQKDGTIATYQTLPWDMRGWHCGGAANNTHISFEICEDGLQDSVYFNAVYKEAVELTAYLCEKYHISPNNVICHSEGYRQGIASNHSDVMHWFPKHGKSMDTFRNDVTALLSGSTASVDKHTTQDAIAKPRAFLKAYARSYTVSCDSLNMRSGAGVNHQILSVLKRGTKFRCYGYYTDGWLYGVANGKTGFCSKKYLK